jgi:hypothetical protein
MDGTTKRTRRTSIALLAGGAASLLVATVMAAVPAGPIQHANAEGANGTIKIGGWPVDDQPSNDNDPHITCPFNVEFYNFDTGAGITNNAEVTFFGWDPTGKDEPVLPTSMGRSSFSFPGPDTTEAYSFSAEALGVLVLQPNQGYHVKIVATVTTVSPQHENGQQTAKKSKVFWLTCTPATPTPSQSSQTPTETPTTATPTQTPTTATPTQTSSVLPTQSSLSPTQTATVLPTSTTKSPTQGATVLPTSTTRSPSPLPFTGLPTGWLRVLLPGALGVILFGAGLVLAARRPKGAHL